MLKGKRGIKLDFRTISKWAFTTLVLSTFLSACGGDSNKSNPTVDPTDVTDTTAPDAPSNTTFKRLTGGKITVSGSAEPGSTITVTFADGSTATTTVSTDGKYTVTSSNPVLEETATEITIVATDTAGNSSTNTAFNIPAPVTKTATLTGQLSPTVPLIGVKYRTSLYNTNGVTSANGSFRYKEGESVSFIIAGKNYTIRPKATNSHLDLLPSTASLDSQNNLIMLLVSLDKDGDASNGIDLTGINPDINATLSTAEVIKRLYKFTGEMPKLLFSPSLGINTEAPQAEADGAGQAMPFVDIFRTARPFAELSKELTVDDNGWPTEVDPALGYAKTKVLQGTLAGAIPSGTYTLIYEGTGRIQLGGPIANVRGLSHQQGYTFDLNLVDDPDRPEANALNMNILDIGPGEGNYIKNIRIIMPGGLCQSSDGSSNPFIRVNAQADCPTDTQYTSFVEQLDDNDERNNIIFNPDYLSFLRNFKVVRMMNLMESSHGTSACAVSNNGVTEIDKDCVLEAIEWKDRAKLNDAVWGGSGRTDHTKRNGIAIEAIVKLANTLKRDMWVNMPHYANDEYITEFSKYVAENLNEDLKTYIEYSNETWNPGFIGHHYVEIKGVKAGLTTVPDEFIRFQETRGEEYFARLRYYSSRSVEIFKLWKTAFNNSNDRLIRVLGTSQGDTVLSDQMLKYVGSENVDALAMAPYFFGCSENKYSCSDAPLVLKDAKTVDDVFSIIDQPKNLDPSALAGTIAKVESQVAIASRHNVQLLSYEGGQHLTTSVMGALDLSESEKATFRKLFKDVNRDPRMKERYETLLNAWKSFSDEGTTLFTLYTLPQSFYRFGNWGLKEHLNKSRAESPKFDGVMSFQEAVGRCWWDQCE